MISPAEYMTWEALLLSGQVPDDEVARIIADNTDFADWLIERARQRQS